MAYVYIQEKDTGDYYVGKCQSDKQNYQGSGRKFKPDYKKNPDRWTKTTIASGLTNEQAQWLERCLVGPEVVEDPTSFNLALGGESPLYVSEETRQKLSEASKEMWKNPEHKQKAIRTGWTHSEETKRKIRESNIGKTQKAWNKGIATPTVTCPHRGKVGSRITMPRWHFDNCKHKA